MNWDLPTTVKISNKTLKIRNNCDYRVVLDVIEALNDIELDIKNRIKCALLIFYENLEDCDDLESAIKEMMKIINNGEEQTAKQEDKPRLMDWDYDFTLIAPAISRVLGYSVRDAKKYTHWYDFIGAYMEIGECTFSTIVSIRSKRAKGKKLEKWEQEFYRENKKAVDLPPKITDEEREWLDSDW